MARTDKAREVWSAYRRSLTNEERFWKYVDRGAPDECWLWKGSADRYGWFSWRPAPGKRTRSIGAHVASYRLFKGPISRRRLVRHTCDNRLCVNPGHLLVGTQLDNTADCVSRRRTAVGERQGISVMTERKVRKLRALAASGTTQVALAERFKISQPTVSQIVRRATWEHVA